jgi:putative transposase
MPGRPHNDPLPDNLVELTDAQRDEAMEKFTILRPHLQDGIAQVEVARASNVPLRTIQRWVAQYKSDGLMGLARQARADAGSRRFPPELIRAIESLALGKPRLSAAAIHRRAQTLSKAQGWPAPSYAAVHEIIQKMEPALLTMAHEGTAAYRDRFELIIRHRAERPNVLWQADHTALDLLILDKNGKPARPWLTVVIDDHSRAIAGYTVFVGVPTTLQTALALRQAIWRKGIPDWPVCGIPDNLYVDHGSDFTSRHLEQVGADLRIDLTFSTVGRPQGRGKIERFFGTINSELLPELPGFLVKGKPVNAPRLSLSDLDKALGSFIVGTYNSRAHSEIGVSPHEAWVAEGWLPRLPDTLEALDLLLISVAKQRLVRRDGIYFQGLRYLDPTLAAYVGEHVTIRYDPRDITEVRVFFRDRFLCRAVSPEHASRTISLKDIEQARSARRRALRGEIVVRAQATTDFLPKAEDTSAAKTTSRSRPKKKLSLYKEDLDA